MTGGDLPEPSSRTYTLEERRARKWQLFITLLLLCTAYSILHKLILPLGLKLTRLHDSPYAIIDPWFLHPLILLLVLRRNEKAGKIGSFLAGVGICYGAYQSYEVLAGLVGGWLAFSRLLSSIPVAFVCILILSTKGSNRKQVWAWSGTVAFCLFAYFTHDKGVDAAPQSVVQTENTDTAIVENQECGATRLAVEPANVPTTKANIEIAACGLSPSIMRVSSKTVRLSNNSENALNLHLVYFVDEQKVGGWNFVLPAKTSATKPVDLVNHSIGVIYSDSAPKVGITVLIADRKLEAFRATRNPLGVKRN